MPLFLDIWGCGDGMIRGDDFTERDTLHQYSNSTLPEPSYQIWNRTSKTKRTDDRGEVSGGDI